MTLQSPVYTITFWNGASFFRHGLKIGTGPSTGVFFGIGPSTGVIFGTGPSTGDFFHDTARHGHRKNTQPEVRLRVGAFDVGVLVFSAAAIFLASVHGKCFRYTEDIDVVFTYLLCG